MNLPPPLHDPSPSQSPIPSSEDEMTAAMGFSTFGTQPSTHPAKRKKYTHDTEGGDSATGGNMLPLGVPRVRSTMEGMESKEGSGQGKGIPEEKGAKLDDEETLKQDDERTKDQDDESSILLKRQAELLRRINGSQNISSGSMTNPTFPSGILQKDTITTPSRKAHTVHPPLAAKDGFEGHTWNEWRRGVRNGKGDMAFYDASFVEDPWRGLRGKTTGDGEEGAG
ncbi:MAG: hypothetical protein Q9180_001904 [Flavoplaca navasiana]